MDEKGLLKTSNPKIKLEKGSQIVNQEHISGNNSVLISPESPYGFAYQFKNLNFGDLIEVEAWIKGKGGQFVVSGNGKNCDDFFTSSKSNLKTEKNGWSKVLFVCTITKNCDSSNVKFFVWNPGSEKVYIDDVKFRIKVFKDNYLN
jgi:hypothetical protein